MVSTEVLNALNNLQKELERLEPAIQHIEAAIMVTSVVKDIPNKHLEFVALSGQLDKSLKDDLVKYFREEVRKIKDSNSAISGDITDLLDKLSGHIDAVYALKNQIESFHNRVEKIGFPERLDKIDASIANINIGTQNLRAALLGATSSIQDLRKDVIISIGNRFDALDNKIEENQSASSKQLLLVSKVAVISLITAIATLVILLIWKK